MKIEVVTKSKEDCKICKGYPDFRIELLNGDIVFLCKHSVNQAILNYLAEN